VKIDGDEKVPHQLCTCPKAPTPLNLSTKKLHRVGEPPSATPDLTGMPQPADVADGRPSFPSPQTVCVPRFNLHAPLNEISVQESWWPAWCVGGAVSGSAVALAANMAEWN